MSEPLELEVKAAVSHVPWELKLGPLEEQQAFIATEPPPHSWGGFLLVMLGDTTDKL